MTALVFACMIACSPARAQSRIIGVMRLDDPATGTYATDTLMSGVLTTAAIYYDGAFYDIPRDRTDLVAPGTDFELLFRGRRVGEAGVVDAGLYPCCEQPLAARARAAFHDEVAGVSLIVAASGASGNATGTFRASVAAGAVRSYHNEYVRVGGVGLKKQGVAQADAQRAQPTGLAIVQPAPGAPILVIGSLVVPRATPECTEVFDRLACVRHAFFMVARHEDKSLRPVIWSYTNGDKLAAGGWEFPVDVMDVDADGDADLVTEMCTAYACEFHIYTYAKGNMALSFRGASWNYTP